MKINNTKDKDQYNASYHIVVKLSEGMINNKSSKLLVMRSCSGLW